MKTVRQTLIDQFIKLLKQNGSLEATSTNIFTEPSLKEAFKTRLETFVNNRKDDTVKKEAELLIKQLL